MLGGFDISAQDMVAEFGSGKLRVGQIVVRCGHLISGSPLRSVVDRP